MMKKCFKCLQIKPLSDFYKHPRMADGHLNKCKECNKMDTIKNRRDKADYYRAYDCARAKLPERKAKKYIRQQLRRANGDAHDAAHNAVARAIKSGLLTRLPCQMCGTTNNVHAHHDDYSLPLDVMWLCPIHHRARHDFLAYIGKDEF